MRFFSCCHYMAIAAQENPVDLTLLKYVYSHDIIFINIIS